jgi:3-(3-hydroxy-phenyl)propionate hydroxylase
MDGSDMREQHVMVVGAGPVGVVAGLAAAQAGFRVTLCEAEAAINTNPRASTTQPSTLELIERVGLLERFLAEGLVARTFQFWDRPTRTIIAEFDHAVLAGETRFPFVVQTEQHKLAHMALDALRALGGTVRFGAPVADLAQDADRVTVTLGTGERLEADWVIGADGGRSTVRKQLGIAFEGYTWPERFLVLTVLDDYEALMGCCTRNYLADPDEWMNLFKVAGDDGKGRWRAVFPARADETDDEALSDDGGEARLQRALPIATRYRVVHRNLYKVHQRVAASFRAGRVFLAGDSAHVNNPIGGLGLNFGIHDAIDLIDSLVAVRAGADAALLDRYERRRRPLNIEFVQQQTIANKQRLEEKDPAVRRAKLDELAATAADPKRHKQFLMRASLIDSVRKAATID